MCVLFPLHKWIDAEHGLKPMATSRTLTAICGAEHEAKHYQTCVFLLTAAALAFHVYLFIFLARYQLSLSLSTHIHLYINRYEIIP